MWSLNLSLSPLEGRNDNATYFARITISSRNMYSAQHSVYMFLTFFICQNNSLKKKKINYFLHITIKDVFFEFVNHFFGVCIETALMKIFKGRLMICFH